MKGIYLSEKVPVRINNPKCKDETERTAPENQLELKTAASFPVQSTEGDYVVDYNPYFYILQVPIHLFYKIY